jgi:Tfp pilus assembly protein PilN
MSQVQFNLLPDVKLDYEKVHRTKHQIIIIAAVVAAASVGILFIMLSFTVALNQSLKNADKDIKKYTTEVQKTPNLDDMLTVQNQLQALPGIHENKHATSRIFTYLPQITPTNVNISKSTLSFDDNKLELTGTTDSLASVNKFIDTIKYTEYQIKGSDTLTKAFPTALLTSFGVDAKGANYVISVDFDPILFSNKDNVTLVVPKQTTTHSVLNDPTLNLFNGQPTPSDQGVQ